MPPSLSRRRLDLRHGKTVTTKAGSVPDWLDAGFVGMGISLPLPRDRHCLAGWPDFRHSVAECLHDVGAITLTCAALPIVVRPQPTVSRCWNGILRPKNQKLHSAVPTHCPLGPLGRPADGAALVRTWTHQNISPVPARLRLAPTNSATVAGQRRGTYGEVSDPIFVECSSKRTSTTLAQTADATIAEFGSAELRERWTSELDRNAEQAVRERAYIIWDREGRPEGPADDHWRYATIEALRYAGDQNELPIDDEEKILAGRADANFPALLTKDVKGG
jgi:hypothetical protein